MASNGTPVHKAAIYSRCSTDDTRQDTENQLRELRRYCEAFGWEFDEVSEYDSGYKGRQEKLQEVLEQIKHGKYQVFVVWDLSRFSRAHPSKVNALLDSLVQRDGCRFISKQEGIDSDQPLIWHCIKPLFSYFAFVYSQNLSEKIKLGIQTQKAKGNYTGGRPRKTIEADLLKKICPQHHNLGWQKKTELYNQSVPRDRRISISLFRQVCRKLSFDSKRETNGQSVDAESNCFLNGSRNEGNPQS